MNIMEGLLKLLQDDKVREFLTGVLLGVGVLLYIWIVSRSERSGRR